MHVDHLALARRLILEAREAGRASLLETEGFLLLEALGIAVPRRLFARTPADAPTLPLASVASSRLVVKVVAPGVAHKTERGGVVIVDSTPTAVAEAIEHMQHAFAGEEVAGFSVAEFVSYDPSFGGEWLLGLRWTDEFGPVVTIGAGGVSTEFLASVLKPGRDTAAFLPGVTTREALEGGLRRLAITALATGSVRRQPPRTSIATVCEAVERLATLAPVCRPDGLLEFEVNPLVTGADGLVALDVLATFGDTPLQVRPARPLAKLRHLMTPRTIAVTGVSSRMNPGRIILRNLLREGFDRGSIYVVKPGVAEVEGCRAVPSIGALPTTVDLLVLSVAATQAAEALIEATESRKAESIIVIPGGLEEKSGTSALVDQMHAALAQARGTDWGGPVVNGGNCLGIQSRPGRYDTMFIPGYKLGATDAPESPLAIVSQSGAFAVSRTTRLSGIQPRFAITVGNQMDLTIGDYLAWLERDPALKVFAVYVEGFTALDGRAALEAVQRITAGGRTVLLYRAGRTIDGARATASHTAAVAGDYAVTRDLFRAAGATVADSLEDFTDLVMLYTLLEQKAIQGRRVGAMSNAGYECVAIADSLGTMEMPQFTDATVAHLDLVLERHRVATIVDVHNPLDVTPMMNDAGYAEVARTLLSDARVDVGVIGCVPATPALSTLAAGAGHDEDLSRPDALAAGLIALRRHTSKPFVAVVDAGPLYDPLAHRLLAGGIPTFRSADRAMRLLNLYVEDRFAHTVRAQRERWVDEFSVQV